MPTTTAKPDLARVRAGESLPVGDYGLLADCSSAALVSRYGSIDWVLLARQPHPAAFAAVGGGGGSMWWPCPPPYRGRGGLGGVRAPGAGHWSIAPAGEFTTERG